MYTNHPPLPPITQIAQIFLRQITTKLPCLHIHTCMRRGGGIPSRERAEEEVLIYLAVIQLAFADPTFKAFGPQVHDALSYTWLYTQNSQTKSAIHTELLYTHTHTHTHPLFQLSSTCLTLKKLSHNTGIFPLFPTLCCRQSDIASKDG